MPSRCLIRCSAPYRFHHQKTTQLLLADKLDQVRRGYFFIAPQVTFEITRQQIQPSNHWRPREPALRGPHHQEQRMISDIVGGTSGRQISLQVTTRGALRAMMIGADVAEVAALEAQHHRARLIERVPSESARQTA